MPAVRDFLIRLAGAEPATFVPVARAYARITRRRSRLRESQRGRDRPARRSWFSPFHLTCLMTLALGLYTISAFVDRSEYLSGFIIAATLGFIFIGSISLFDYFDLLFSPEEYRVLGAHPHHAWSILVAKLAIVGRAILTLAFCFFLPSIVTVAIVLRDPTVTVVWAVSGLIGAAAVGASSAALGSWIVAAGGRSALLRVLPWVQATYLVVYFGILFGREALFDSLQQAVHRSNLALWFLPSAWFTSPVEWAMGITSAGTWVRMALGAGSLFAVAAIGARATRVGFGEKMLVGGSKAPAARVRSRRTMKATKRHAERAFARIAAAHAKTDLAFRGQLVLAVIWPVLMVGSQFLRRSPALRHPGLGLLMAFMLPLSMGLWAAQNAVLISSRRSAIEVVLAAPVDRVRFAFASVSFLRRWILVPYFLALTAWYLWHSQSGEWMSRFAQLAGVALILDTEVYANRGVNPEFPFASGLDRNRRLSWGLIGAMLAALGLVGFEALLWAVVWRFGGWLPAAAIALMLVVRVLVEIWAKRRVRRATAAYEAI